MSLPRTVSKVIRSSRRSSRAAKGPRRKQRTLAEIPEAIGEDLPLAPPVQRVFLYIQLNEVKHLPETNYPLELHLYHVKNTLQSMSEHYTTDTIIYQNEFDLKKPTFTLSIIQDDINDMNIFSDNPLIMTLYQRVPRLPRRRRKMPSMAVHPTTETDFSASTVDGSQFTESLEEEDDVFDEEHLEFVSRGHCDLLQVFQRKRFISDIDVYLYPNFFLGDLQAEETVKRSTITKWHMYTILPILKVDTFTNLAFITLESVYNVNQELIPTGDDLTMRLSFRSTVPDEQGEYHVVPLCEYFGMNYQDISEQHTSIVWENMKRDHNPGQRFGVTQMQTGSRVKLPNLFRNLLLTEGVNFCISKIDPISDAALINNSMHRYVLNEEMSRRLEYMIVHNTYQLQLEFFKRESPENIIYHGLINLSVFAYPEVNYVRFGVALDEVASVLAATTTTKTTPSKQQATHEPDSTSDASEVPGPTFAVVKICMFQRITEKSMPLDYYNINPDKREKLQHCTLLDVANPKEDADIVKELYRDFDEFISQLMIYMAKRKIKTLNERRDYFCCQLANLNNLMLKLCGADFNLRMPTKSNVEFREMLTHMYKELIERVYHIVMSCGHICIGRYLGDIAVEQQQMMQLISNYKYLVALDDSQHAEQLYYHLNIITNSPMLLRFFMYLHKIEMTNFGMAMDYIRCRQKRIEWDGEYFVSLSKVYTMYMLRLGNAQIEELAFEYLLKELLEVTKNNLLDRDCYVLLYCYYKQRGYLPGMEFTRWRFENLYVVPRKTLEFAPVALYSLYLNTNPEITTPRSIKFYQTFKAFVQLGMYVFAQAVFAEIQRDCSEIETYLISTVLQMLQKKIDVSFQAREISTDNSERGVLLRFYQYQINGNMEYERGNLDRAEKYFVHLLEVEEESQQCFWLSLLRLGKLAMEKGNFELAKQAYECCGSSTNARIQYVVNYGMGRACYRMDRFEEAITYLSQCTEADLHTPNAWGYLAIINLRLGHNKLALECWKCAKLHPETTICDEVYEELAKINPSDVNLLVQ